MTIRNLASALTCGVCVMAMATPAQAQSSTSAQSAGPAEIEGATSDAEAEIIVTAQKRAERLQDVPISISVLGGRELDRSTAQGANEALNRVPGVLTSAHYQGGTQVSVRGVAANGVLFRGASPIAYYIDSVPFGFVESAAAPDADVYDLDRIEVLRGPQGTLYGASTLGGVVRILTKEADFNDFEFKTRAAVSLTEGGGDNYRGDLAVNVPLVEDVLAVRAVVGYQGLSGWIDQPNRPNANDAQLRNYRLKVGFRPTRGVTLDGTVWISRSDRGGPSASRDGRFNGSNVDLSSYTDYDIYALRARYEHSDFAITSSTSYLNYAHSNSADELLDGFPLLDFPTSDVFTQDILINSLGRGDLRWSLGGMYRSSKENYYQKIQNVFDADYQGTSRSVAVFGEVTHAFLNRKVELTLGLRYFRDKVTKKDIFTFDGSTPDLDQALLIKGEYEAVSPRAVLTWFPNKSTTIYASYAEGFRSGRVQGSFVVESAPDFPDVKPDTLKSYELGTKGNLFGNRLTYEIAAYYNDWRDVQLTRSLQLLLPASPAYVAVPINGDSVSGVGVDASVTVKPMAGLNLGASFSWNNLGSDVDVLSRGVILFAEGDRMNYSPETTFGLFGDYSFPLGQKGLLGRASASANYASRQDFRNIQGGVPVNAHGESIFTSRAAFSIESEAGWIATIFVENLTNESGPLIGRVFDVLDAPTRIRPRTFGLQFEYRM